METLQILGYFGLGSVVTAFVIFISRLIYERITGGIKEDKEFKSLMRDSMKGLLRVEIRREYNEYYENKKYIPMAEKQDFENIWTCYHAFGEDKVLEDCYEKVMDLPPTRPLKNRGGAQR